MKKGIVMELHQKYTIIMTEGGSFQKAVPIKDAQIGAEVVYQPLKHKRELFLFYPRRRLSRPLQLFTLACIVLLFIFPFYFFIGDEKTYAYVNVDINPSIELEIDASYHVNSIQPLNKDALGIVDGLTDYQHKNLESVIEMIIQESEATGLVNKGKHMLVGVSYATEGKSKDTTVLDHIKKTFTKENPGWEIAAFMVPGKIREKAKKSNKSMNEVMATTIMETDNDNDVKGKPEVDNLLDEKDKAIINSFYKTDHQTKPETNKKSNEKKPVKNNQNLKIKEKSPTMVQEPNKEIKLSNKKVDDKHKGEKSDKRDHKQKKQAQKKQSKNNGKHKDNKNGKHKDNHNDKKEFKNKQSNENSKSKKSNHKHNNKSKKHDKHKKHEKHKKREKYFKHKKHNKNNKHQEKHNKRNHKQKSNHH